MQLSGPLKAAYEKYSSFGLLHDPAAADDKEAQAKQLQDGDSDVIQPMALDDALARVYLARLACKLVFSGVASGSTKQFLWKMLLLLAFSAKEKAQVCRTFKRLQKQRLFELYPLYPTRMLLYVVTFWAT